MTREIDFVALGITGSERYKPATPEQAADRIKKQRLYAEAYRQRNREKERARWRAVAQRRRGQRSEAERQAAREVNRAYYAANRERILAQKKEYYERTGNAE